MPDPEYVRLSTSAPRTAQAGGANTSEAGLEHRRAHDQLMPASKAPNVHQHLAIAVHALLYLCTA